jgi:hypothetical protein
MATAFCTLVCDGGYPPDLLHRLATNVVQGTWYKVTLSAPPIKNHLYRTLDKLYKTFYDGFEVLGTTLKFENDTNHRILRKYSGAQVVRLGKSETKTCYTGLAEDNRLDIGLFVQYLLIQIKVWQYDLLISQESSREERSVMVKLKDFFVALFNVQFERIIYVLIAGSISIVRTAPKFYDDETETRSQPPHASVNCREIWRQNHRQHGIYTKGARPCSGASVAR